MDNKYVLISIVLLVLAFILMPRVPYVNDGVFRYENGTVRNDIDVNIQDYFGEIQSYYLILIYQYTTISSNLNIDKNNVIVINSTGCLTGDAINIYDNESFFQAIITNKVGNNITFTPKTDKDFSLSNTFIECGEWNMNVNGAITQKEFVIHPPTNVNWHIESTNVKLIDNADMDSFTFGSRTALANGYTIKITDGYDKSLFLIYNNVGFTSRGFDYLSIPKAPSGVYMNQYELLFEDKYGAIIELKGSTQDKIVVTIKDDLTSQTEVSQVINGHRTMD